MAYDTETINIDTVEKSLWDKIVETAEGGDSSLPAVTSADNGDLLGVVEGAWGKVDPPAELPAVSSTDNGSLLGVSDGEWAKVAAPTELPAVTGADNGSLLGVSEGAWAKVADKSPMVITGTQSGFSVTITTPLADIKAAYEAHRTVKLIVEGISIELTSCTEESNTIVAIFTAITFDADDKKFNATSVTFNGTLTGAIDMQELAEAN